MKKAEYKYLDVGSYKITYLGSLDTANVLLFIRRSNTHKNSAPLQQLLNRLVLDGYLLLWTESKYQSINKFLNEKCHKTLSWLDQICGIQESFLKTNLRRLIKGCSLLCYPAKWGFLFHWKFSNPIAHDLKLNHEVIRTLCKNKSVSILSHSAGGVIASYLTDEPNLHKIICFGYPFKHPEKTMEVYRTERLKLIHQPFLIIQGIRDEYGGLGVENSYDLSPAIRLEYVDATHEYENLSEEDWSKVIKSIDSFLMNPP